jgi:acid phosphatase type 7
MASVIKCMVVLPLFAASASAAASYPPKPSDLTTPVQQRIAINGPDCK